MGLFQEDRKAMETCEASGGHVYPQTSGHAWRCMPGMVKTWDTHDCRGFFEPLPQFVLCAR